MKAAVLHGLHDLRLDTVEKPSVKPSTILLRIHACAICGSDMRILGSGNARVTYPAIIGHEASGEIVAVGDDVKKWNIGDRVALGADVPCGECAHCTNGRGNCCDANYAVGYQFAGAFAEYCLLEPMMVKYGPIIKIPELVGYEEAALMEPTACILNGFELAQMQPGKSVLIIGAGPIGCLGILVAKALGASKVYLAEMNGQRLEEAKNFGADVYINSAKENMIEIIKELTAGKGIDRVFTMCPAVEAHEQALHVVAKRGVVNLFGGLAKGTRPAQIDSNLIHYKECFVMGSHGSTPRHNQLAMDFIASGKINVKSVITHRFSLERVQEAFAVMQEMKGLKVMVKP
ncbi:alcohol dehydrogenase catalytic domain-containing protein [Candidatus Woesearchaeota archaeon]|nr:alcohol dehydrogenase catalytic domain-containing protein [Candidatus Woesearchaeota archaeon]